METTSIKYHDLIAGKYDGSYDIPFWRFYHDLTWRYIQKFLPEKNDTCRILDAGGGTGIWSIKLAELGFRVVLSDVSEGMLNAAREKIREKNLGDKIEIVTADIVAMPIFQDETFDLVLAEGDPVSYCSNPDSAVAELSRVAKNSAHVIISADNRIKFTRRELALGNFKAAEKVITTGMVNMPTETDDYYPAYAFTFEELKNMLGKNGLEVVFQIGKPVFVTPELLNNQDDYERLMNFELTYSTDASSVNSGGHIAVVGKKLQHLK